MGSNRGLKNALGLGFDLSAVTPVMRGHDRDLVWIIARLLQRGFTLLGGFLTLRPDHLMVIQGVKEAKRQGRWSLIVHSRNATQTVQVEEWFNTANISAVRSL